MSKFRIKRTNVNCYTVQKLSFWGLWWLPANAFSDYGWTHCETLKEAKVQLKELKERDVFQSHVIAIT